jgi:hypothetical protein
MQALAAYALLRKYLVISLLALQKDLKELT